MIRLFSDVHVNTGNMMFTNWTQVYAANGNLFAVLSKLVSNSSEYLWNHDWDNGAILGYQLGWYESKTASTTT